MKKEYTYPKLKVIFPYILVLLIPFITIPLFLQISAISLINENFGMNIFIIFFLISICGISLGTFLWMINKLKTTIRVDERGIAYNSLFKTFFVEWKQISSVERKYLFEKRYPRQGLAPNTLPIEAEIKDLLNVPFQRESDLPSDLIIKTKNHKEIKILHILRSRDDDDIIEFENEITKYGNIIIDRIAKDEISGKDKKEWRNLLFASVLLVVIGVILTFIKLGLVSLAFIFFGMWLFLFYSVEHISRYLK